MITRDEALERARAWISEGREAVPEIGLHEFDLGWVAWPEIPAPADLSRPPASTGGPQIVVDRETGEITTWPPLPAPLIAEQYAKSRAVQDRFPPEIARVLLDAGWFPGRDISGDVDAWARNHAGADTGWTFFPAARAALREFGGLDLPQYGPAQNLGGGFRSCTYPYPYPAGGETPRDSAEGFTDVFGVEVFQIGDNEDGPAAIVMDEQGRVFLVHWADSFYLGAGIDQALVALIRGESGTWPTSAHPGWPL